MPQNEQRQAELKSEPETTLEEQVAKWKKQCGYYAGMADELADFLDTIVLAYPDGPIGGILELYSAWKIRVWGEA
jgi:hypothetical protein